MARRLPVTPAGGAVLALVSDIIGIATIDQRH
jgi:hypothetical protein